MHDNQIREQLVRWAQPLAAAQPPALPVLRRRVRRRTIARAAISGLAAMAVVVAIALSGLLRAGRAAPAVAAAPAVPRHAVLLQHSTGGQAASVLDMGRGKFQAVLTPATG